MRMSMHMFSRAGPFQTAPRARSSDEGFEDSSPAGRERRNVSDRLSLEVPAAAAAVPGARRAITRMCEHLGLTGELTERIRLAVTEACTNCVLHAYGDAASATFAVEARVDGDWLLLVVRDYGQGMTPGRHRGDTLNLGLHLLEELADSASVSTRPGRGTRVAMRFAIPPAG
jgi:anti-sigma regulatory factor (Ser/Thr protein kinase)